MKSLLSIALVVVVLFSCQKKTDTNQTQNVQMALIGSSFELSHAIEVASMEEKFFQGQGNEFVVRGKVEQVCQKKGCWMKLQASQGKTIHVKFKDYALFMPFDIAGKEVVMHGVASYDTLSVKYLRHLAEDAQKPAEEVEKITEPEIWVGFEADGVAILNYQLLKSEE